MPVVDDENELHDRDLSTKFNQHFHRSTDDGIIDLSGNYWYLVQENELANFVSLFEGIIGVPMGRILHNSAADCLELILSPVSNMKFGMFASKKRNKLLSKYWKIFGWGRYDWKADSINTAVYASIISGFYLAVVEQQHGDRRKIQWRQLADNLIQCDVEEIQKTLPAPKSLPEMPWVYQSKQSGTSINRLLESHDYGWSIDGKQSFVLPCDLINRIIFNSGGYVENLSRTTSQHWHVTGIDKRFSASMICVMQSFKEVFSASDVFVYLNEANNWESVISNHLVPFGLGSVQHVESANDIDVFTVKKMPNAPILIGKLAGLWERANGKQSKCKIQLTDQDFLVNIQSLLGYN